jgi:1-acyl-sn-glycerol-3-phosphate acyltransferase
MKPRAFFDTLSTEIEAASDRLIAEALAKDPSLAEIVEKGRTQVPDTPSEARES